MNERIKKLAEQAGMTDDKYGMFFAKDKHDEDGVDLEKFAELIVRDCMKLCKEVEAEMTDIYEGDECDATQAGARYCYESILSEFGVTE